MLCCAAQQEKAGMLQSREGFPLLWLAPAQKAAIIQIQSGGILELLEIDSFIFYTRTCMSKCLK